MPVSSSSKQKQFDLKLVAAHNTAGAENALRDGNWWIFPGKVGWITIDSGRKGVIAHFSLSSTNPNAAVKTFKLDVLLPSKIIGQPYYGDVSDEEYCKAHGEAWETVVKDTVNHVPEPPVEYNFAPIEARFWRVSFSDNFGDSWIGINRITLSGPTSVVNSVLHGGIHDQHRATICKGISGIYRSGSPGTIVLYGADAFPIAGAKEIDGLETIGCAGSCIAPSGGKIVAFSHNGYISGPGFSSNPIAKDEERQSVQLLSQILRWCSADTTISIAFLGGYESKHIEPFKEHMNNLGVQIKCVFTGNSILENDVSNAVHSGAMVIVFYCNDGKKLICGPDDQRVISLRSFIIHGGAFLTGICPWGWLQTSETGDLRTNCLLNHVISIGGMAFTDNYLGGGNLSVVSTQCSSSSDGHCFCFSPHLGESVLALQQAQKTGTYVGRKTLHALCSNLSTLPILIYSNIAIDLQQGRQRRLDEIDDGSFSFCSLLNQTVCGNQNQYPPVKFPVDSGEGEMLTAESATESVSVALSQALWLAMPPQQCPSAPSLDFPGIVQPNCQRITGAAVDICVGIAGWQSTGLYIPPGECCVLEMVNNESSAVLPIPPHFQIRIGCHSDRLHNKLTMNRWPDISITMAWDPSVMYEKSQSTLCSPKSGCRIQIASPYGGLLYLEIDNSKDYGINHRNTRIKVLVDGGVRAPWFALDREDDIEYSDEDIINHRLLLNFPRSISSLDCYNKSLSWNDRLNKHKAPWGELEGNFVILSLPRECLEVVDDPVTVLKYWDKVVSNGCRISHQRLKRKERLVCDCQIGGGYMHSGYPVMAQLDICTSDNGKIPHVVNLDVLNKEGSWGLYHEFGHNRQCSEWTFDGAGEVTVNIFSLYCCYKILGQKPYETKWFGGSVMEDCAKYIEDSSQTFDNTWKETPEIGLGTYASFIQRYGFDAISEVFLIYEQMEKEDQPKSNEDKLTEWVKQTSLAVEKDLRPFYRMWKWPFNDQKLLDILPAFPEDDWTKLVAELKRKG